MTKTLVIATCDVIEHNMLAWSGGPASYLDALAVAGCLPVQLPVIDEPIDARPLLDVASGVLVTGARSNVHPSRYGMPETEAAAPFDHRRDRTTLPLIREAVARGLPLLAICRGIQEMNVAFGGSLHVAVHEVDGRDDHRSTPQPDIDAWFALRHEVTATPGGVLAGILGEAPVRVNSVHRQAVDRIGDGLAVEATAPDGTVEALSVTGAKAFALGVQWHPEHFVRTDGVSRAIFDAFAAACRAHAGRDAARAA